jgi:hypothetical protein
MGKITKKVLFGLIIIALALPMFVGCEPDTPAVDYKADFLSALKSKVDYNQDNIIITVTNQDIAVTFEAGADVNDIRVKASDLVDKLKELSSAGTQITINSKDYSLYDEDLLDDLKADMRNLFTGGDDTHAYTATVKYEGQTLSLAGNITVTNTAGI